MGTHEHAVDAWPWPVRPRAHRCRTSCGWPCWRAAVVAGGTSEAGDDNWRIQQAGGTLGRGAPTRAKVLTSHGQLLPSPLQSRLFFMCKSISRCTERSVISYTIKIPKNSMACTRDVGPVPRAAAGTTRGTVSVTVRDAGQGLEGGGGAEDAGAEAGGRRARHGRPRFASLC